MAKKRATAKRATAKRTLRVTKGGQFAVSKLAQRASVFSDLYAARLSWRRCAAASSIVKCEIVFAVAPRWAVTTLRA
jgi:hypothetical protein